MDWDTCFCRTVGETAALGADPEAGEEDDGLGDDVLRQAEQDAGQLG